MSQQYRPQPANGLRRWPRPLGLLACLLLGGCSTLDYYSQMSRGHLQLMQQREPIEQVLADPSSSAELRQRLGLALQARRFASSQLGLPDNQSYRLYADIQRPVLMWNAYATPEFSLKPQLQCFPIAGCVAYRGYFDLNRARGAAALQQLAGMDSWVGGVEAYSTLGWFDDPILSSMSAMTRHSMNPMPVSSSSRGCSSGWPLAVNRRPIRRSVVGGSSSPRWCWIPAHGWKHCMPATCPQRLCVKPSRPSLSVCAMRIDSCARVAGKLMTAMSAGWQGR